jgi:hypothetical protein
MKTLFVFLFVCFSSQAFTKSYYLSSTGDDSRTSTEAQSQLTPWKSIQKLNTIYSLLKPGDSVLFRRGDVFYGSINIDVSGTNTAPIVFGSYGNGEQPVITGFNSLSGWKSTGNNNMVWEATLPNPVTSVNMVTVEGQSKPMGRYPNSSNPNKGYLSITSHIGSTQITGKDLSSGTNWTNGEIIIRKTRWQIERGTITQHNGSTVTFNTPTGFEPEDNFGFFIQNHPGTLDQKGEWYFDRSANKLLVFFGSTIPANSVIQAATIDNVVMLVGKNNIVFENLSFQGANSHMFRIQNSSNISIKNCNVLFSGFDSFFIEHTSNFSVQNTTIENSNNGGILCYDCHGTYIAKNTIKNVGVNPGMGKPEAVHTGIQVTGSNHTITNNNMDSIGYNAINFDGDSVLVKNNFINHFGFVTDDGGGIYTWNGFTPLRTYKKRQVIGNIILNGIGAGAGTNSTGYNAMHGIYMDDKTGAVEIADNTVAYCGLGGIYVHNAFGLSISNNNLYCNEKQLILTSDEHSGGVLIRDVNMKENVLFSKKSDQYVAYSTTNNNDLDNMGSFDKNYYCRPADDNLIFYTSYNNAGTRISSENNLVQWQSIVNQDFNSRRTPFINPSFSVSAIKKDKFSNEFFTENTQDVSVWSQAQNCVASRVSNKINSGTLQISFSQLINAKNTAYVMFNIGEVEAGKTYQVRFDMKNGIVGQNAKMFLRKRDSPYNTISNVANVTLPDTIASKRFVFTAQHTESNTYLILEVNEQAQPLWLDNFQVNEADVNAITPDKYVKFFYNPTSSKQTFLLDTMYSDMKGTWYNGKVEVEPFSSVVLMKPYGYQVLPFYFTDVDLSNAKISWKVAFESGIRTYEIQGSADGKSFHNIGNVLPAGKGFNEWYDFNVAGSIFTMFRIKAVDQNQNQRYSKIVKAHLKENISLLINNPVTKSLEVSFKRTEQEKMTLNIYSSSGNLIKTSLLKNAETKAIIDVSHLTPGTYVVSLQNGNFAVSRLFLKN